MSPSFGSTGDNVIYSVRKLCQNQRRCKDYFDQKAPTRLTFSTGEIVYSDLPHLIALTTDIDAEK